MIKRFCLFLMLTAAVFQPLAFADDEDFIGLRTSPFRFNEKPVADELELKDGSHVQGNIIAQNAAQIFIDTKDKGLQQIDVSDIKIIHFGPVLRKDLPKSLSSISTEPEKLH